MQKDIVILDLFSGIGGFSKGLTDAGFNISKHYFSEIDKHTIAVYKYNFKDSIYAGSVTTLDGRSITRPNIVTFGSPCQDFSLAGKRAGIEGQRSSLIGEAIRLITECKPDVFIWENVKGVFSSNTGADFWAIIQAFTNIGGYRIEWQLLNTAWLLPQNRERIYLIGHLAETGGRFVLPFRDSEKLPKESTGEKRGRSSQLCGTITSNLKRGVHARGETYIKTSPVKHQQDKINDPGKVAQCLVVGCHGNSEHFTKTYTEQGVRKLTEIECERLQGFPDNWTMFGDYDGVIKPVAKSQRYKMCGNAVTVKVVEKIGRRLLIPKP